MNLLCRASLLLTLPLVFAGCSLTPSPAPIVIGHVSDKTRLDKAGDQAELGLRLALHDLNKDNALTEALGGRPVQVRHTDTRGQLDAFESQAVRLDSVNRSLALFGGLSGPETLALNHAKLPLLTFHGQPVSGAGNQVFYLGMSPAQQGIVLAKGAALDPKASTIVFLVDERRSESATLADAFEKSFADSRKEIKGEPAVVQSFRFGKEVKWDDMGKRLQTISPRVVVFAGTVVDFNAWHKVVRKELADDCQVIYAGDDGDHRLFDLEGDAKSSVTLATAFYADPASEKVATFMKAYRDAYSTDADVHSALAYDGFRILIEAMKPARTQLTAERVREELLKTKDFAGLTGPLTITADRQVQRPLFVVRWQNGTLTAIKTMFRA